MYFFLPPAGLAVAETSDLVSLGLFVVTGLGIALSSHLRIEAESARRAAAALAAGRAERLDAILNTAVDGIIVINAKGEIEEFNRGAERLFGFPAPRCAGATSAC
jgi:PAS domain-containing protein